MSIEKFVSRTAGFVCLAVAACSGGGGSGGGVTGVIESAVQDLDVDPDGLTTVITFNRAVNLVAGDFEADGGQVAQTVSINGAEVTVTWDERVTPSHEVRVAGVSTIASTFEAVTTTDDDAPTVAITDADQVAGLGNDTITVQFTGARVVESEVEDVANWTLEVNGEELDLAGSTLVLDVDAQELVITTGSTGNLHASFTLTPNGLHSVADVALPATAENGTATGDSTAPTLVSAEQNLTVDEYGRTVDFTFSEAMDPTFSIDLASFVAASPDLAIGIDQPDEDVLRVTFSNPMVPGVDSVDLENLVDAHGNAFADQSTAIAAGSTVANAWDSDPELLAVSNQGGDQLVAVTVQALDPDTALDGNNWILTIDPAGAATVVDLTQETLDYDLTTKTLTITLTDDYTTATEFTFEANSASAPLDVDGEDFLETFDGEVGGDSVAPAIDEAKQKRGVDSTGLTIDVRFDEDLDETTAETLGNWSVTNVNVVSATLQSNFNTVRLVLDDVAVPGDDTLSCSGVNDLAGNTMTAVVAQAIVSSDTTDPAMTRATASVVEGDDNDTLVVVFSDDMLPGEAEDAANWTVESPIGTALDVSAATIDYRVVGRQATLTFNSSTGVDLLVGDDFQVALANMRDLGGNTIDATPLAGVVTGELEPPELVSAWVESGALNTLHVRFSEPCAQLDDVAGMTEYAVYDSNGALRGYPVTATPDSDAMGVELVFGFALAAGSDVLDVRGVLDLGGNPLFAVEGATIEAEDTTEVALSTGQSAVVAVSGENNDTLSIEFAVAPSPWLLLDPNNYEAALSGTPVDLSAATLTRVSDTEVEIVLDADSADCFASGATYDVSISGLMSAQGLSMSAVSTEAIGVSGDTTPPTLPANRARLDPVDDQFSVILELNEALSPTDAAFAGHYYNQATNDYASAAEVLGFRTVRVTFDLALTVGDVLQVIPNDMAGNSFSSMQAITAADTTGPLVTAVTGTAVSGEGLDVITVAFDEEVELASALNPANYTITMGTTSIDVANAAFRWTSSNLTAHITLPAGVELDPTETINVQLANVYNLAGIVMSPSADVFGAIGGDTTAPDFARAFTNYRADGSGVVIDVLFDEDVDATFASDESNWTANGGQTVSSVAMRTASWYRVTLSAALVSGDTLELDQLPDLARNESGTITIAPVN